MWFLLENEGISKEEKMIIWIGRPAITYLMLRLTKRVLGWRSWLATTLLATSIQGASEAGSGSGIGVGKKENEGLADTYSAKKTSLLVFCSGLCLC